MTQRNAPKTTRLVLRDFSAEARKIAEVRRQKNAEELSDVDTSVIRATLLLRPEVRRAA